MPDAVTVYEVGPRDGLQNERVQLPTDIKIRFIDLLSQAELPYIEITSFVRPEMIPHLADAEKVAAGIVRRSGTRYVALVPNMRGMDRALTTHLDGIALFTAASETFNRRNTNASIAESLERFRPVVAAALAERLWVRGYVSTAFGCPFEGSIAPDAVARVASDLIHLGVSSVAISDTIGVATPKQVREMIAVLAEHMELARIGLHFHDTRGTALANVLMGLQCGVRTFDSAAGGLGGCPYAPGATGNLATEDLLYLLHGMGIETGVSLDGVVAASRFLAEAVGRDPASRYYHAASA